MNIIMHFHLSNQSMFSSFTMLLQVFIPASGFLLSPFQSNTDGWLPKWDENISGINMEYLLKTTLQSFSQMLLIDYTRE